MSKRVAKWLGKVQLAHGTDMARMLALVASGYERFETSEIRQLMAYALRMEESYVADMMGIVCDMSDDELPLVEGLDDEEA